MSVEVNGVSLSETAIKVLKQWQEPSSPITRSRLEDYIDYLGDTQDYLTRVLMMEGTEGLKDIGELLTKLICIKDDLKLLITPKNGSHD